MNLNIHHSIVAVVITASLFISAQHATADTEMLVPITPALSPDGSQLVFSWEDDLWLMSFNKKKNDTENYAERLTIHPGREFNPQFSPDGKTIYYNSNKEGSDQIYAFKLDKSEPIKQITFHSSNNYLEDVSLDGKDVIYRSLRDLPGRYAYRIYESKVSADQPENMLFNVDAKYAKISSDGSKFLIVREGTSPYRLGYKGSQAGQIWIYDKVKKTFSQPVKDDRGCLSPLWLPDGSGFYYLNGKSGHYNLYKHDLASSQDTQLTHHDDSNIMFPTLSRDGTKIIYRHLFHYYTLDIYTGKSKQISMKHQLDLQADVVKNIAVRKTENIDFSASGLEITFTANGNIFVMDTVLREPVQLTDTPADESNLYFGDNGKAIYYILDDGITSSIEKITKKDATKYWWEKSETKSTTVISTDNSVIKSFSPSPDGKLIGYTTSQGEFYIYDLKKKSQTLLAQSWNSPSFEWSPNSEWIAYSLSDNQFNSDIYIAPADGSLDPVNVTKHPDNEYAPTFSPDGKKLAFVGKRHGSSYDLYYVDLVPLGSEKSSREQKLETARKAMKKDSSYNTAASKIKSVLKKLTSVEEKADEPAKTDEPNPKKINSEENKDKQDKAQDSAKKEPVEATTEDKTEPKSRFKLVYDLTNIQKRIQHISLQGVVANNILWKHDSKGIIAQNTDKKSTTVFDLKTKKGTKYWEFTGTPLRYAKNGDLYFLSKGIPGVVKKGKLTNYTFTAQTESNKIESQRHRFRLIWRTIRDGFYDEHLNGKDWGKTRDKYEHAASIAGSNVSFDRVINMMLGELNASHMGYRSNQTGAWRKKSVWIEEMAHLGLDYDARSDGWLISNILAGSPATSERSKLVEGEIITHVNGTKVNAETLQHEVLWLQLKDKIQLTVTDEDGDPREVNLSPISYLSASKLKSNERINDYQVMVDKLSNGKFGYVHIARMHWDEFTNFEKHLYENGAGKDGLIIDVRDNSGGFTTDHLLTALTQPSHAYTLPRHGGLGYPQDRYVYATWQKPIVVLCNQNSFSNAEIFAHAIKSLKRGKLVGVPTAGGVISAGSQKIQNHGTLRMPFRGWFLTTTGEDMEQHGASPTSKNLIWTMPGQIEQGKDNQMKRAIQVLRREVKTKKVKPIIPNYRNR